MTFLADVKIFHQDEPGTWATYISWLSLATRVLGEHSEHGRQVRRVPPERFQFIWNVTSYCEEFKYFNSTMKFKESGTHGPWVGRQTTSP